MISKGKGTVERSFNELVDSIDDSDMLAIEARILMFRFLGEVDKICRERGIQRKDLAFHTGTSASYITQLFQGKKFINFLMLAKIQKVLDITFNIAVAGNKVQHEKKVTMSSSHFQVPDLNSISALQAGFLLSGRDRVLHQKRSIPLKLKKPGRTEKTL